MRKKIKIILVTIILIIQLILPLNIQNKALATSYSSSENISFFNKDITFKWEYVKDNSTMSYGLFTPSNADKLDSVPLIVWLHGYGEVGKGEKELLNSGLPAVLKKWNLEGFNAYVLCPHAKRKWNNTTSEAQVKALLDKIISEYNIDTKNIVLVGHSVGGQGALYLGYSLSQYFSRIVVLSGYTTDNWSKITKPIIFYCGKDGEDESCIKHMKNSFIPTYGEKNCFWLNANHGAVPRKAFTEDNGVHCGVQGNGRSDLLEWMFEGWTSKSNTEKMELNISFLKIEQGKVANLSVSNNNLNNEKIVWKSANTSIATVDSNGSVTAVNPGTTKIIAQVSQYTSECEVTVTEKKSNNNSLLTNTSSLANYYNSYVKPNLDNDNTGSSKKKEDVFSNSESFLTIGKGGNINFNEDETVISIQNIRVVLMIIGTLILECVIIIMGIKYMTANPDDKAKLKTQLIGVIIAGIVIFGAYYIWRYGLDFMQEIISNATK